jgi:hypothetical protein
MLAISKKSYIQQQKQPHTTHHTPHTTHHTRVRVRVSTTHHGVLFQKSPVLTHIFQKSPCRDDGDDDDERVMRESDERERRRETYELFHKNRSTS